MDTQQNYGVYMKAMSLLEHVLSGKEVNHQDVTPTDYRVIHALLRHADKADKFKNGFPKYINSIFRSFSGSVKAMNISMRVVTRECGGLAGYLVSHKVSELVCVDYLVRVFRKVKEMDVYDVDHMSDAFVKELMAMLERVQGVGELFKLTLHDVRYAQQCIDTRFLAKYAMQFRLCASCRLSCEVQDRLVYHEEADRWTKVVECSDLVIIRCDSIEEEDLKLMTTTSDDTELCRSSMSYSNGARASAYHAGLMHKTVTI